MPSPFTTYSLDVEVLLTWFPLTPDARLKVPHMQGSASTYSNKDILPGHPPKYVSLDGTSNALFANGSVSALVQIRVTVDSVFDVDVQLYVGGKNRSQRFLIPANTRVPFMIDVTAAENDEVDRDTAAVFQGVFTGSPLPSLLGEYVTLVKNELKGVFGP